MGGVTYLSKASGLYSNRMRAWAVRELAKVSSADGKSERLDSILAELAACRPFEIASDRRLQQDTQALWDAAGVTLGVTSLDGAAGSAGEGYARIAAYATYVYEHLDCLEKLLRTDRLPDLKAAGKHGVIWHWHDAPNCGESIEYLNILFGLGLRSCGFTHGHDNRWVCGQFTEDDVGLKPVGRTAVRRMNELGILADLAHCSAKSMLDLADASHAPVAVSHTGCRSVAVVTTKPAYTQRNITDEALRAIADKGGIVCIGTADFLTGGDDVETFLRHIDHAVNTAGIDHVGVGSDAGLGEAVADPRECVDLCTQSEGACDALPVPTALSWINWPYNTTVALVCRGYSDADILKIIGGNYQRVAGPIMARRPRGRLLTRNQQVT